jgi:aconitate decarboxylase
MLIDKLVSHALDTPFKAFPAHVIEDARLRLIDVLSCTIGGAKGAGNAACLDLIRTNGGTAQATILGHGDRVPVHQAAMMNALMCRSFDFEVTGPEAEGINAGKMVGHVCSTTEPTAFSVAEFVGASGEDLLAAVIIGGDIGARMAVADEFDFDKCFEVCGTANAFGATALAGRLFGANHDQLRNAFGILVNLISGSYQSLWDGVDTFKLPGAMAAEHAVRSVQLAIRGFSGLKDPLESPLGYFSLFGNNSQPSNALADLGTQFYSKGMHKLHPSCYGNHNPIESALELARAHDIQFDQIDHVTLDVPPNRIKHFLNQPVNMEDQQPRSLFSIPYGIANALMRRGAEIEHYTEEFIRVPTLLAMTEKVRLVPSRPLGNNQASRLTVHMKNGTSFTTERTVPLGWAENPVGPNEVRTKYWRNIAFAGTVSNENATRALHMLDEVEKLEDVSVLAPCLVS